ncbi:hypothetical protein [Ellagibacter isourolithinifaciens]|uniref:hypothetical protein n=1 Tax=Ellagibacter isourolithinifaciens TaxID=2137581 RepID=UPI003A8EF17B
MKEFEDILLERFGEGRPILVGDILSLFPDVSRVTVYQRINSAISKGSLERYGRGVYCIPRQGLFGKVPLSAESVIERKFIACGDEVFGYYSGLALENRAGLSEQVPAVLEITTNASSKGVRSLGPAGGWKDVVIRKPRCEVTAENVDVLRFLDAVSAISPKKWARRHFAAWAALRVRRAETVPSPMLTIIRQRPRRG